MVVAKIVQYTIYFHNYIIRLKPLEECILIYIKYGIVYC
jgi:hypothetical protein